RRQVPFVGLLAITASTCLTAPSSVAVFALSNQLATEPVLLNFMISFATMSWVIGVLCIALEVRSTMTVGTIPSQQNNVNPFFLD
ncbi:hypothetical protein AVEN_61541-1, partial [Araneus ventricosus]